MLIKRRKLGTVYEKSPAQRLGKWASDNTAKLIFSILGVIGWFFVLYVIVGIVNFVGSRVAEFWQRDLPVTAIYNQPYMVPIKIIGALLVVLYVFRDIRRR